jgi:hypothetical protein
MIDNGYSSFHFVRAVACRLVDLFDEPRTKRGYLYPGDYLGVQRQSSLNLRKNAPVNVEFRLDTHRTVVW